MQQPRLLIESGSFYGVAGNVWTDVIQRGSAQIGGGWVRPPAIRPLSRKLEQCCLALGSDRLGGEFAASPAGAECGVEVHTCDAAIASVFWPGVLVWL